MKSNRIEAFSDAVIAIIITIMVLEMRVPHGSGISELRSLLPAFLSYVLSFIYVGIYWNNHHHLLQICTVITGGVLWSNLHLLFWLSLLPFTTGWMGENHFASVPTALYSVVLLMTALGYYLLQEAIIRSQGPHSVLREAIGYDHQRQDDAGTLYPCNHRGTVFLRPGTIILICRRVDLVDPGQAN